MAMVYDLVTILAALAFGVILGRVWEMRKELRRKFQPPHEAGFVPRLWEP